MLVLQAVPAPGHDVYKLLKARMKTANTWKWANKGKTRLKHVQISTGGYIRVTNANGVLVAHVKPKKPGDLFYLAEKFMGRLVAWFQAELAAVNVQFIADPPPVKRRRRRTR